PGESIGRTRTDALGKIKTSAISDSCACSRSPFASESLAADSLLPIALGGDQLKRVMDCACRRTGVVSAAAVTNHHITDPEVEQAVQQRRSQEARPRPFRLAKRVQRQERQA